MRNKRDEIRQAIIIYRSLSYIWCNCGSHRIHHGHLPHSFSLSLGGGVGHWQTSRHLPGIKCLRLTIACASCRCVRRLWRRCSQLLCWWFVLDTGHGESFLTLAYTKLIILLILFGFSFVFWPQTFLLAHKKKYADNTGAKQSKANVAVHVATFFSRLVLNLYSRCDETVNEVRRGVEMVG